MMNRGSDWGPTHRETGVALRGIAHVLFKRKVFLLLFFMATLASASVVALLLQPQYQATAQLMVSQIGDRNLDGTPIPVAGAAAQRSGNSEEERTARAVEILTGRTLAELVVRSIGADVIYPRRGGGVSSDAETSAHFDTAVENVRRNLQASISGKSSWITLAFRHPDAAMSARVVNEFAVRYLERFTGMRRNPQTETFVQEQVKVLKDQLDRATAALEEFKGSHRIAVSARDDQDAALRQLSTVQTESASLEGREAELASRLDSLRGQASRAHAALAKGRSGPGHLSATGAAGLKERLAALEVREDEMSQAYTVQYPPLQSLRAEITALRARVAETEIDAAAGDTPSADDATVRYLNEEMLRTESELVSLRAKRAAQAPQLTVIHARIGEIDQIQAEYTRLQQQVQVAQDNYRLYLASAEQARIGKAMDEDKIADLRVVEAARIPGRPEPSKAPLIIALAAFMGLVGGVAIVMLQNLLWGGLETVEDVETHLDMPVLASVPLIGPGHAPSPGYRRALQWNG
jgi:uncharacterized protein involved in exopolysaccharide biosynthesis